MELLLELLLTLVLSVLIAFLLGKIVSVAAPEGGDPDACGPAEGPVAPSSPGLRSLEASAPGPRGVFCGEGEGEAEAIGEISVGSQAEGREVASACGDDRIEMGEDRRSEEDVHLVEELSVVEGLVAGAEEARAKELGLEEADARGKVPDASVEETEESLPNLGPEEIEGVVTGSAAEDKLLLTKDGGQVVNSALPVEDEKEVAEIDKELDADKVGTESATHGENPPMAQIDDVKAVPYAMTKDVELESEEGGPETRRKNEKMGSLFTEDDDWEGIEKSDLQKLFAAASAFVGSNEGSEAFAKLSNDLQMQLYGLHKIATEGPCYESQPMSLKVSARAKWHAWQRLGSMNPEVAMEQYISLLSANILGWMPQMSRADDNPIEGEGNSPDERISDSGAAFLSAPPEDQVCQENERMLESHSYTGECDMHVVSKGTEQGENVTDSSLI